MRLRDSRKLSKQLVVQRRIPFDYYKHVVSSVKITFCNLRRYYVARWKERHFYRRRSHKDSWRLISLVAKMLPPPHKAQGTYYYGVRDEIEKEGLCFKIVRTGVDRPVNIGPKPVKYNPDCVREISKSEANWPSELRDKVNNNWIHSDTIVEDRERSLLKLGEKPPLPANRLIMFLGFVRAIVALPKKDGKIVRHDVDISMSEQDDVSSPNSSCGYVPVRNGEKLSTKKEAKVFSIYANEVDKKRKYPKTMPCKSFLKSEVLKKGKTPRAIQIQSDTDYKVDSIVSHGYSNPASGSAIGLNTRGGLLRLFANWYFHGKFEKWSDFVKFLEEKGAHESDKTGWDSSTNANDGWPFLLSEIIQYDKIEGHKLLVRALTNYANPLVELSSGYGYFAKWRVPSGTERTSYGNTMRHQIMNWVITDLFSLRQCGCEICNISGTKIDPLLCKLRRAACIMGDDYGSVSWGEENDLKFDRLMDKIYGTTTKTSTKNFFSTPGLGEVNSFEFLRNHFFVDHNGVIVPFRSAERVLAKLKFGQAATRSPAYLLEAVRSAMLEIGANQPLFSIIKGLGLQLEKYSGKVDEEDQIVENFRTKTPEMVESLIGPITYDHVKEQISRFADHFMRAKVDNYLYNLHRTSLVQIE